MKKYILAFLIILAAAAAISAQELEINGNLRSDQVLGLETGDFHKIRETLNLKLEYWGEQGTLYVSPYLHIDPLSTIGDQPEWGIREAYIDLFWDSMDLRVGKQAVFWGQAEGAFITDIVSPQNLGSFILADFEEIRLGVPAVKATAYIGPLTLETIWVQKFVPAILPGADSLWRTGLMPDLSGVILPEANLENSEIFARASYFGPLMTLEIMGGYSWNDLPVAEGSPMNPDLIYHRSFITGGNLSTTVGAIGLRAEGAVTLNKPYSLLQPGSSPVLVIDNHHLIQGLIGLDGTIGDFNLSVQYILNYINNFNPALVNQKEILHTTTLRIQRKFLEDRLTATLFSYVGFDPMDSLLRPEVSFWIEDGLKVSAGADIFLGEPEGKFGIYEGKSQITASLQWYF
jgi:hypothetical protein